MTVKQSGDVFYRDSSAFDEQEEDDGEFTAPLACCCLHSDGADIR